MKSTRFMVTSAGSVITCVWLLASFAAARPADPPGGDARSKLSAVCTAW